MKPPMNNIAYKVATTRNAYGDYTAGAQTALKCHVRYTNDVVTNSNNEVVQSDAMAWFEQDSGVVLKDILKIDGEHFRVERLIKARRLKNKVVQFIKVDLLKYGPIS